ncbi:hypothetical protein EVAR_13574_1 [Eumeta japonica]|uniref:Uncharacterized protein n=1 Tax=Eumeta variegata TaxID=151549 RepID=A0A4C1U8M8_EUMVA|nr:hypothetical protein EVAR_13574_1 [Eumeta japonica]
MVSIPEYVKKNIDEILIEDKNEHTKTICVMGSKSAIKIRYTSAIPQEIGEGTTHGSRPSDTHYEPELDALLAAEYDGLRYLDGLEIAIDDYLAALR